jgi:hypothetical protein
MYIVRIVGNTMPYIVNVPVNGKILDEDPTYAAIVPFSTTHSWFTTSHTLRSFRRSGMLNSYINI